MCLKWKNNVEQNKAAQAALKNYVLIKDYTCCGVGNLPSIFRLKKIMPTRIEARIPAIRFNPEAYNTCAISKVVANPKSELKYI